MNRVRSEADRIIAGLMEIGELHDGERARALVIEDDPLDAEVMHRALFEVADVEITDTGEAALDLIQKQLPAYYHLMFIDLNLGKGISGLDVMRVVRKVTPKSGLILVTGAPPTFDQMSRALEGGIVTVVKKPLEKADARKIVQTYCPAPKS